MIIVLTNAQLRIRSRIMKSFLEGKMEFIKSSALSIFLWKINIGSLSAPEKFNQRKFRINKEDCGRVRGFSTAEIIL